MESIWGVSVFVLSVEDQTMNDRNHPGQPTSAENPNLSDDEVVARRNSLEMMRRPHLWSQYPLLPLKLSGSTRTGVLFHGGSDSSGDLLLQFIEGNMFVLRADEIEAAPKADIRQLVNDGWVVD
jgi:hypothetical protein